MPSLVSLVGFTYQQFSFGQGTGAKATFELEGLNSGMVINGAA